MPEFHFLRYYANGLMRPGHGIFKSLEPPPWNLKTHEMFLDAGSRVSSGYSEPKVENQRVFIFHKFPRWVLLKLCCAHRSPYSATVAMA